MRERTLQVALLFVLSACDTRPLPAPPEPSASASATAAPVRSAPFHALSAVIASASAAPTAPPAPLPGMPALDRACTKDDDCAATYFDTLCCTDCMPRLGNKPSVKKIETFCKENKPKECRKPEGCGMVFGTPRCNNGQCIAR